MHVNETYRQITLDTFRFMDTLSLEGVSLAETWVRLLLPKRVITGKETKRGVLKTTLQTIYLFISIKLNFPGLVQSVQVLSCVWLFVIPWTVARQISLSVTNSQSFLKLMSKKSVMPSNHLILCHPLLLLSSIFPSIGLFSNESTLGIRWPKYWSFNFSIRRCWGQPS